MAIRGATPNGAKIINFWNKQHPRKKMCSFLQNHAGFTDCFFTFAETKNTMEELKRPRKGDRCIITLLDSEVKRNLKRGNGIDDPGWAHVGCKVKVKWVSRYFPVFICENQHGEDGIFWDVQLLREP
jgi:hypothetical protein